MASPKPVRQYRGHKADVLDVAWSKSHQFLLSASMDRCVRLWHISRDDCLRVFRCACSDALLGALAAFWLSACWCRGMQQCSLTHVRHHTKDSSCGQIGRKQTRPRFHVPAPDHARKCC